MECVSLIFPSHFIEIEALATELQGKKKLEIEVPEEDRIAFGEKGKFDEDIYGGRGKFDGYYTTIAPNDDVDVSGSSN